MELIDFAPIGYVVLTVLVARLFFNWGRWDERQRQNDQLRPYLTGERPHSRYLLDRL